jgi:hypothetical protein
LRWIDVLALAAMAAEWILVPRWAALTSAFYRRRGMDFGDGIDLVCPHPFANQRRDVFEAEDTVGTGANDHACVADLGDDGCGS